MRRADNLASIYEPKETLPVYEQWLALCNILRLLMNIREPGRLSGKAKDQALLCVGTSSEQLQHV
jgi:hypothetical protein